MESSGNRNQSLLFSIPQPKCEMYISTGIWAPGVQANGESFSFGLVGLAGGS